MAIEKLSQGVTFKGAGSTMGLVLFVVSILVTITGVFYGFSLAAIALGSALTIIGFLLFLSIRGVLIDDEQKRVKPYVSFFIKIGTWESLTPYDRLVLRYANESQTMNSRAGSVTHKTRSFEIFLVAGKQSELLIKEFTDYDEAKTFLSAWAKKLGKVEINGYEQMKEQLQKRRQQVRR